MKCYIYSMGCPANLYESEIIAGILKRLKIKILKYYKNADLVIINACTVKGDQKFLDLVKKFAIKEKKKVIACGCIPDFLFDKLKTIDKDISIVPTYTINKLQKAIKNPGIILSNKSKIDKLKLPHISFNKTIGIILISQGCLSSCSYCSVKKIKGNLTSFSPYEIKLKFCEYLEKGKKEIWITSQDNGCYGLDIGWNLPKLLKLLIKIPGNYKIRIGMANPRWVKDYKEELALILKSKKIFKFLHLPLESGSDKILKDMNRGYSVLEFINLVKYFRKKIPKISIASDIIVGYPTETDEDFKSTIKVITKIKPEVLNISKFKRRKGTIAYNLKPLNSKIVKQRSVNLTKIFQKISFKNNKKWLGWKGMVIIDEIGDIKGSFIGRNFVYKPVVIKSNQDLLGKVLKVKITDISQFVLYGEILK